MAGDTPGHILPEGCAKKAQAANDLPGDYLLKVRETDPEAIADPHEILSSPSPKHPG